MAQDQREMLELLNFELKFLEDGGHGRSPRTPWRARNAFEDSLSCGCGERSTESRRSSLLYVSELRLLET